MNSGQCYYFAECVYTYLKGRYFSVHFLERLRHSSVGVKFLYMIVIFKWKPTTKEQIERKRINKINKYS